MALQAAAAKHGWAISLLLLAAVSHVSVRAQNIDTKQPYIRSSPDATNVDYFGYSVVLHQTTANSPSSTVLIVGAPNGTAPSSPVNYTGLIYSCPLSSSTCTGLTGSMTGSDRRLYDTDPNSSPSLQVEEKSGQFLGSALVSKGGTFMACGHRYFNWGSSGAYRSSFGRCFISGRSLRNFVEFQPCNGVGVRQPYSVDVCQAGISAAIANISSSGPGAIAVGSPGTYTWRGIVIRDSPTTNTIEFTAYNPLTSLLYGYFGYSMTSGHITSTTHEDYLASSPDLNNLGAVTLVSNDDNVNVIPEPLQGQQISELYGFSVITADLTGDGYDEVLVGAPLYSMVQNPEAGRVYVYRNVAGSLQLVTQLYGNGNKYGRFGHAMVNLGDINSDGFEDVAISAPFSSDGGKVYIYNGQNTNTINPLPAQIILGRALSTTVNLTSLVGFGASLASQVDVDGNTYNDLAIGSYQSKQAFVLRTRPIAQLSVSLTASSLLVQVYGGNYPVCVLNSVNYTCFNVSACVMYTGSGVSSQLKLNVTVFGDTINQMLGLTSRVFFGTNTQVSNVVTMVTATIGVQSCTTLNVYVKNKIADILDGFVFNMSVSVQDFTPPPSNGATSSQDLSSFPILSQSGASTVQVQTKNGGCGACVPVPDLSIQLINITYDQMTNGSGNVFIAQETTGINIWLKVSNQRDDAFATVVTFSVPKTQLTFIRCGPDLAFLSLVQDISPTVSLCTCQIANPLIGGQFRDVAIRLEPAPTIDSSQLSYSITFNASSQNAEYPNTTADNAVAVVLPIQTLTALSIDSAGIVKPEQIILNSSSVNTSAPLTSSVGPYVLTTFTVRNGGPSTIPLVGLDIYWPLNSTATGATGPLYYLIPTSIKALSSVYVTQCDTTYTTLLVNGPTAPKLTGNKRAVDGWRRARQASDTTTPLSGGAKTVFVNCFSQPQSCVRIRCSISQLSQDLVTIVVNSTVDSRFFAGNTAQYTFIPYATVSISGTGSTYITDAGHNKNALADITVISNVYASQGLSSLPWWVYVVIIVPGLLFLLITAALVLAIIYYCNKRRQAIKNKYQDQQALTGAGAKDGQ